MTRHSHDDASTYLDRARAEEQMLAVGRFKNEVSAQVPSIPTYPKQPAGSPWAGDVVPDEPPLGYSIDKMSEDNDG